MAVEELRFEEGKLVNLSGETVSARPTGPPFTLTDLHCDDMSKRSVEYMLSKVIGVKGPYVRGEVDKRMPDDPTYVPIQLYEFCD